MALSTTKTTRRTAGNVTPIRTISTAQPAAQGTTTTQTGAAPVSYTAGGGTMRGAGAATPYAYQGSFGPGAATTAASSAPYGGTFPRGEGYQGTGGGLYTYTDFLDAMNASGLAGQFSPEDLAMAEKYPEFGMGVLTQERKYSEAATPEERAAANDAANRLRSSYGNYTGGSTGGDFMPGGKIPGQIDSVLDSLYGYGGFSFDQERPTWSDPYRGAMDELLGRLGSYGGFSYGAAPSYQNQYAELQKQLLDDILNRPDFNWNKETDPLWSSYKKSYLREGERATDNALARAAAASGGRPSSYAVSAAAQAGDYYATQLNDIIPKLYQQAYQRYLDEDSLRRQDLGQVNNQEQMDYQRFLGDLNQYNADRSFAYQDYLDDFLRLKSQLGAYQQQGQMDYQKYLDDMAQWNADRGFAYDVYSGDFDRLLSKLGALQGQDQSDYDRYQTDLKWQYQKGRDAIEDQRYDTEWNYGVGQNAQELAQAQVDAMLQSGGAPSADLVAASGYSQEYVNALRSYYLQQQAAANAPRVVYRSSEGGDGGDTATGGNKWAAVEAWVNKYGSESAENYIKEHYKELGYASQSAALAGWSNHMTELGVKDKFVPTTAKPLSSAGRSVRDSLMTGGLDLMSGMVSGGLWGKSPMEALDQVDKAAKNGTMTDSELSAVLKYYGY